MSQSGGIPPIFKSDPAAKAVITLVLIENSQEMVPAWSDLRGHYLPTLLGTMRVANPVVPIPILWLTTAPVGNDSTSQAVPPPRQYNQLPDLKFSFQPGNRISSRIINRSIELILKAALRFHDGPVSLHLIIVAASSPLEGIWSVAPQAGKSEWQLVAEKLAQNKIHCHMILRAAQNMRSLEELFLANVGCNFKNYESVAPWFTASPDYSFHLSSNRLLQRPRQMSANVPASEQPMLPVEKNQPIPPRPSIHRHQSSPLESTRSSPEVPTPGQGKGGAARKIHGLSRKKLYSAQTTRQPFVREEPVRAKYRQAPTPLSIPANADDKHGLSKNRVRSPERSSQSSSPSDPISPGRRSPRSIRGMSPSDIASIPALPAPLPSAQVITNPVTSPHPDPLGYMTALPMTNFSTPLMMPPTTQANYPGSGLTLTGPPAHVPSQQPASSTGLSEMPHSFFSPEVEAATAARLQAALQFSPFAQPSNFTSGNNYMVDGVSYGTFSQPQPQQVVAAAQSYNTCSGQPVTRGSNGSSTPILTSATSSSLQGWAG
ncbi:hypothetical protein V8B97DRAFT_2026764 [Scleroderma yunnanense]